MRTATAELTASILSAYTEDSDVEEIWTTWKDGLTERVQQYIPHRTTGPKRDLPWVDYELKMLICRRDRIHKKWKKTGREELYTAFRALKRQVQGRLRKEYWAHVDTLITEGTLTPDQPQPTKKFWAFIKHMKTDGQGISPLKEEGKADHR